MNMSTAENSFRQATPMVSVLVPARNEEANLAACLESLVGQNGIAFEIVVIDDHSTDRTAEVVRSFPDVMLVTADPLPRGWCGKQHALYCGMRRARGEWLLFTDADTVHRPGSLARALDEAEESGVALLSYSPEQEVRTVWERAIMPVVFAELACTYKPSEVCDPASPAAAANGQYLLIRRDLYDQIGGHSAFRDTLLEDVAMAKAAKLAGGRIRFRFGGDAVSTRMYRRLGALWEGWTKNLALLFPHAGRLAMVRAVEFTAISGAAIVAVFATGSGRRGMAMVGAGVGAAVYANFVRRIARAHFGWPANLLAIFGLPFFSLLLLRSAIYYGLGRSVSWRGREYRFDAAEGRESEAVISGTGK